jgi:hypothetical protein
MDTKRNLRYFTAPLISPYTIAGFLLAVVGLVGMWITIKDRFIPYIFLLGAIAGVIIIIYGRGRNSKPADIDFQISEKIKYMDETAQKKHEVYESHFNRIVKPVHLKGFDYLTKDIIFKRGSDNKNRTSIYNAAVLYFNKDTMFVYGMHFSLIDELFDKEILASYKFTDLDRAEIVEDVFTYVRDGKYTYHVNTYAFRVVTNDGKDAVMMTVSYGADMDQACSEINHVIKLAKEKQ